MWGEDTAHGDIWRAVVGVGKIGAWVSSSLPTIKTLKSELLRSGKPASTRTRSDHRRNCDCRFRKRSMAVSEEHATRATTTPIELSRDDSHEIDGELT
jgi:hypothetical protein